MKAHTETVTELRERVASIYARTPRIVTAAEKGHLDQVRLLVLAGLAPDNPLWNCVLSYADEHARNELEMALRPGMSDGDRQYNAGRAASAEDFATALRDLQVKAERDARRMKGAD